MELKLGVDMVWLGPQGQRSKVTSHPRDGQQVVRGGGTLPPTPGPHFLPPPDLCPTGWGRSPLYSGDFTIRPHHWEGP